MSSGAYSMNSACTLRLMQCLFVLFFKGVASGAIVKARHHAFLKRHSPPIPASLPRLLVITVPGRAQNVERMDRLSKSLSDMGFKYDVVHGPNMDKYCPANVDDYNQSKAAGMKLMRSEWKGRTPDVSTYDLALFQMACLTAHLRAWFHIVETKTPMVVLEDDIELNSAASLQSSLRLAQTQGADAVLLDSRHCSGTKPPHLPREAAGLAGYWLNVKAATALLAKFPLDIPADWGVNKIFNEDMKTVCPHHFPLHEYGGDKHARLHSAAHGCRHETHMRVNLAASEAASEAEHSDDDTSASSSSEDDDNAEESAEDVTSQEDSDSEHAENQDSKEEDRAGEEDEEEEHEEDDKNGKTGEGQDDQESHSEEEDDSELIEDANSVQEEEASMTAADAGRDQSSYEEAGAGDASETADAKTDPDSAE